MSSLGGLTLAGPPDANNNPTPLTTDCIDTDRMGTLTGRTVLSFGGRLPSSTAALLDVLIVDVVKPQVGNFPLNTAINFDADANNFMTAASYVFGDLDTAAQTVANFYWSSSGSITLAQAGDQNGSPVNGMVSATNYREIDENNADVPGGCTTSLMSLNFNLIHMDMAFQPTQGGTLPGLIPLTADEWKAARAVIDAKMANVQR